MKILRITELKIEKKRIEIEAEAVAEQARREALDREIESRFGALVRSACAGGLAEWERTAEGALALVILLDQFNRNIHRGTPGAFAGDERALALAQHYIETGHYRRLPAIHQGFLYMPLEHAEDLEVQEECVTLFEELAAITGSQSAVRRPMVVHSSPISV